MASFWDRLKRGMDRLGNLNPGTGSAQAPRPNVRPKRTSSNTTGRKTTPGKSTVNSKYTGGNFKNFPRNLMSDKAKRDASNRAQSARYTAQAKAAGKKIHPSTGVYERGVGYLNAKKLGGGGGGAGGFGGESFEDILAQMGLGGSYESPKFDVEQIDVAKTLAAMFDPQFGAIKKAESNAKGQHKKSDKAVKAAFDALAQELNTAGKKDIEQTYGKAKKDNASTSKSITKDLQNTVSRQSKEDMEMAAALGIGSALDENSSGRGDLNKAIADVASSTKSANNRLNEFESIDKQQNKDAITVANLSGEGHRADLNKQVAAILAGLDERRVDTTTAKANKRADLEAQNQAAVNQANAMEAQSYQDWTKSQNDLMMNAASMQMDRAKMQNDLDIAGLKADTSRYGYDSRADSAAQSAMARASNSSTAKKPQTALQELLAKKPEGLSSANIIGIVDNLTNLNKNGDWDRALAAYYKKYPKSGRSKRAAAEYVRQLKKGR